MKPPYHHHHILGQDVYLRTSTEYRPHGRYVHHAELVSGNTTFFKTDLIGNSSHPRTMQECIMQLWKGVDDFIKSAGAQIIAAGFANNERIEGGLAADLSPGPGDTQ